MMFSSNPPSHVVCLGRPAVDYVLHAPLETYGLEENMHRFVEDAWLDSQIATHNLTPSPGGSMGNTAWVLGRLGITTTYLGATGNDEAGHTFFNAMKKTGVAMPPPATSGKTKRLLAIIGTHGERAFLGTPDDILLTGNDITTLFPSLAKGAAWALVENYSFKVQPEAALTFMRLARKQGFPTLMTLPNHHILPEYQNTLQEAETMADIIYGNLKEMDLWQNLAGRHPEKGYLQTLDAEGARWRHGTEDIFMPCPAVTSPVDTNGAGDSFLAGFIAAFTQNQPVRHALQVGHTVAAVTISQHGPRPLGVSQSFLQNLNL